MRYMETYWQRVTRLREAQDMSREKLAQRADLTASYIYRIEKGGVLTPSYATVKALARGLSVGVEVLMEGEGGSGLLPTLERIAGEVIAAVSEERANDFSDHLSVWASLVPRRQRLLTDIGRLLVLDERAHIRPSNIRRIAESPSEYEAKEE